MAIPKYDGATLLEDDEFEDEDNNGSHSPVITRSSPPIFLILNTYLAHSQYLLVYHLIQFFNTYCPRCSLYDTRGLIHIIHKILVGIIRYFSHLWRVYDTLSYGI